MEGRFVTLAVDLRKACREAEFYYLGGLGPEDGPHPYDELREELKKAAEELARFSEEVSFLRGHAHEWSDDDYCVHCGADGRA